MPLRRAVSHFNLVPAGPIFRARGCAQQRISRLVTPIRKFLPEGTLLKLSSDRSAVFYNGLYPELGSYHRIAEENALVFPEILPRSGRHNFVKFKQSSGCAIRSGYSRRCQSSPHRLRRSQHDRSLRTLLASRLVRTCRRPRWLRAAR